MNTGRTAKHFVCPRRLSLVALLVLVSTVSFASRRASADTITTFQTTGVFQNGDVLAGLITLDTTADDVVSVNLTVTGTTTGDAFSFSNAYSFDSTTQGFTIVPYTPGTTNLRPSMALTIPTPTAVGYMGGVLNSLATPYNGYVSALAYPSNATTVLVTGALAPATPLPRSAMAGLSLLGLLGVTKLVRRRGPVTG